MGWVELIDRARLAHGQRCLTDDSLFQKNTNNLHVIFTANSSEHHRMGKVRAHIHDGSPLSSKHQTPRFANWLLPTKGTSQQSLSWYYQVTHICSRLATTECTCMYKQSWDQTLSPSWRYTEIALNPMRTPPPTQQQPNTCKLPAMTMTPPAVKPVKKCTYNSCLKLHS